MNHSTSDCVCHDVSAVEADILAVWPTGAYFMKSADLIELMIEYAPQRWSDASCYGRELTAQRMGRYLAQELGIRSTKNSDDGRGYCHHSFRKEGTE